MIILIFFFIRLLSFDVTIYDLLLRVLTVQVCSVFCETVNGTYKEESLGDDLMISNITIGRTINIFKKDINILLKGEVCKRY